MPEHDINYYSWLNIKPGSIKECTVWAEEAEDIDYHCGIIFTPISENDIADLEISFTDDDSTSEALSFIAEKAFENNLIMGIMNQ